MPALKDVQNVIRVVLKYTYGIDVDVINRYYVKYGGTTPDNTALTTFANNISTAWGANLGPMCTTPVTLTSVTCTDLTSPTAAQGISSTTHAGTRVGGVLSASTCGMIDFHIQRRYRGGKPRIYLPVGSGTDLNNAQTWSTTFQTALFSAWNAFLSGGTPPAGMTLAGQCNVSYYKGFEVKTGSTGRAFNKALPRDVPVVDLITSAAVDPRLATQRRRIRS